MANRVNPQPSWRAWTLNAREAKNAPIRNAARWTTRKKAGGNALRKLPMGIEFGSPSGGGVPAHALVDDAAGDDEHADEDGHMGRVAISACSVKGNIGKQTQSQQ